MRRLRFLLSVFLCWGLAVGFGLVACGGENPEPGPWPYKTCTDNDHDSYFVENWCGTPTDCDDGDQGVNPGATEGPIGDSTCRDNRDNDCDSATDNADPGCNPAPMSPPYAPSDLVTTATSSSTINLAWIDNAGDEAGLKIERSLWAHSGFVEIADLAVNTRSYNDTGLRASTEYYYRVGAYNSAGDSDYSNISGDTTHTPTYTTLTVNKAGLGSGTVTGQGIDCGSDCTEDFTDASRVTLTAEEGGGMSFAGWSGCDTSSGNTCTVTMNQDRTVTATFALGRTSQLSYIEIRGPSQVDENSGAQYTCWAQYNNVSTPVRIDNATWTENSNFATISGTGYLNTSSVNVNQTVTVTANFEGKTDTFDVIIVAATEQRRIKITNNVGTQRLDQVVQVKIIPFGQSYTKYDDLLSPDSPRCNDLPGDSIRRGQSRTFDVDLGDDYLVFIGMGIWETDLASGFCSLSHPWIKTRTFTDTNWNSHYVWVEVQVSGHSSGVWEWTIDGSYTSTTPLKLTPAGNSSIFFNITDYDPIP